MEQAFLFLFLHKKVNDLHIIIHFHNSERGVLTRRLRFTINGAYIRRYNIKTSRDQNDESICEKFLRREIMAGLQGIIFNFEKLRL